MSLSAEREQEIRGRAAKPGVCTVDLRDLLAALDASRAQAEALAEELESLVLYNLGHRREVPLPALAAYRKGRE